MDTKHTDQYANLDFNKLGLSSIDVYVNMNGDVCIAQNRPPKGRVVIVVPQASCSLLVDLINLYSSDE
jgi:hypothetical protein